tara:strand:+ start:2617 stop:2988 length:372 start_codon:yes stop_codon:yes gene_type:complete
VSRDEKWENWTSYNSFSGVDIQLKVKTSSGEWNSFTCSGIGWDSKKMTGCLVPIPEQVTIPEMAEVRVEIKGYCDEDPKKVAVLNLDSLRFGFHKLAVNTQHHFKFKSCEGWKIRGGWLGGNK